MPETFNVPITEEQDRIYDVNNPSPREKDVVESVFNKFRASAEDRDRNFEYFDGSNLIDYINDSVRRFVTNVDEREDIEDWQARIHDPFTRNKAVAVLGKVVRLLPIASFSGRGDEDYRKGSILTSLYEYSEDVDDYEELMTNILLECIVKGTAIGYEGVENKVYNRRDVKGTDDDITVKNTTEKKTILKGSTIKLEEFYPQNVGIRRIKDMVYCFWRYDMPYQKFLETFSSFDKAQYVQPKQTSGQDVNNRPFYVDYISQDVQEGNVEVIRYYNKDTDEYIILANGVWINPIKTKYEPEEICPLPWNHKELPFWEIRYDLFGIDFFYGKSLPDKLKSMQDVLNVLENMLLDQSFLTIFPPILTAGFDSIEDDYLRPGRRTPVDTQGLPINQAFMKLDLGTPSGWHQYILEYTRKIMEESSLDQVSQGVAGVGGRTTAQEIRLAADGVSSTLGLLGRMINYGVKRKALLRASNILQFWTDKNSPMIERVLGTGGAQDMKDVFNVIKVDGTILSDGKRGTKIIEMYSSKEKLPTKPQVKARGTILRAETGKNIEIVAMPPEYLRDFLFDIKMVVNEKSEGSKEVQKAMQLEKVRVYLTFFPEQVNIEELAAQTAEKMGDDPTKVLKESILNPQEQTAQVPEGQQQKEMAQGAGTSPQGNTGQNMIKSYNDLSQLQSSMLG